MCYFNQFSLPFCLLNYHLQKLENNYPGLPLLSESSQGEVGDSREKWGDFWEKSIAINQNIV
jgi:hypothetical protein